MNTEEVVRGVLEALNAQHASYMVVGSLATNFYCVPRSTQDADFVVQVKLVHVAQELSRRVSHLRLDPQIHFEGVTATKKALLHADENDFDIELFELSDDAHDQERFARRVEVVILGCNAWIAMAEDMIVTKLRWSHVVGREKDIADARNLISVQNEFIDWPYVERWCKRHGTGELLQRLRSECAPE